MRRQNHSTKGLKRIAPRIYEEYIEGEWFGYEKVTNGWELFIHKGQWGNRGVYPSLRIARLAARKRNFK